MPLFSVTICTYNGSQRLTGVVDSVLRQDASHYRVLVVDGGSEDDTAEVAAGFGAPLLGYTRASMDGDPSSSRHHLRGATRVTPTKLCDVARLARSRVPSLANRVWGRHGTMVPEGSSPQLESR